MRHDERRMEPMTKPVSDVRSPGETDYARVIHSFAFRRLQGKTQIYVSGECDYYRTRLTHSLETAQIAGGITRKLERSALRSEEARVLLPEQSLVHALGCAHDLGHPPFGHGGENALHYCMRDFGGFEGNGQTLRILAKIEPHLPGVGLNLCRRTLLGVLKYPVPYHEAVTECRRLPGVRTGPGGSFVMDNEASKPPKCYLDSEKDVAEWLFEPLSSADRAEVGRRRRKTLDCTIMEHADDIAYGVHDLEDAAALGLIEEAFFRERMAGKDDAFKAALKAQGTEGDYIHLLFGGDESRKYIVGRMVHYFICALGVTEDPAFEEPLYRFQAEMSEAGRLFMQGLKDVMMTGVIQTPRVQHPVFKGQRMVIAVFDALATEPLRLTPMDCRAKWEAASDEGAKMRIICDYVSGMTDHYLVKTYERLFGPRSGSMFDPY